VPITYITTDVYAARTGRTITAVRNACAAGAIPGALRIGGPRSRWAIPETDTTPEGSTPSRAVPEPHPRQARRDDVTSSGTPTITAACRVSDALATVPTSRPARATRRAAWDVLATTSRHQTNRDGACAHCGWTWPCPDYRDGAATLAALEAIVCDGAA
jgi:hypothetical protein